MYYSPIFKFLFLPDHLSNISCKFQSIRQEHKRTAGADEMCSNMLETLDGIVDLSQWIEHFLFVQFTGKLTLQNDTQMYSLVETLIYIFPRFDCSSLRCEKIKYKRVSLSLCTVEVRYRHQRAREPKSHPFLCEGFYANETILYCM